MNERLAELLKRYRERISALPFTDEGIPSAQEAQLTKDIWNALTPKEREKILDNTKRMVAEYRNVSKDEIPDQTPYAMRLTHKYLKMSVK